MKSYLIILLLPVLAACSPKAFTALQSVESKNGAAAAQDATPTPAPVVIATPTATPVLVTTATPTPTPTQTQTPPIIIGPPVEVATPTPTPTPTATPPLVINTPTPTPIVVVPTPIVVVPTPTPGPISIPTPTPVVGDPTAPVDDFCSTEGASSPTAPAVMLPYVPLGSINIPMSCSNGFELNNLEQSSIELHSYNSAGSADRQLAIDIATYTAPDTIQIVASNNTGESKTLIHLCRVRTATYADPTRGLERPPEDSIRRWYVTLPEGATKLTVNNTLANTPTYIRVLGLCDFDTNINLQPILRRNHYRQVN